MLNLTKMHEFYQILTRTYSESNSNDHLHRVGLDEVQQKI